jgi:integrase/recombinase XerD
MTTAPVLVNDFTSSRSLTATQFATSAEIPAELEWFAHLTNQNTRLAYQQDVREFMAFAGLRQPEHFYDMTRTHAIAWRRQLTAKGLANDTIRRKLAVRSSLYAYLYERHAVLHNPGLGVKRPRSMNCEGVTPPLADHQARLLLQAPSAETLNGNSDRTILVMLPYRDFRYEELCMLKGGRHLPAERGAAYVCGRQGDKVRYLLLRVLAQRFITTYLEASGHAEELHGPLFRPVKNNHTRALSKPLHPVPVYHNVGKRYADELVLTDVIPGLCVHSLRATAATNALQYEADIAKVQE